MNQDYYEILQVHPRADGEAIAASYRRLLALYDPARLEGAADELVQLARQKRDSIERAHSVLSDPARRARYDAEQAAAPPAPVIAEADGSSAAAITTLDYRPLPPARRAERARGFDSQPTSTAVPRPPKGRTAGTAASRSWIVPALIVGIVALVVGSGFALTGGGGPTQVAGVPTAQVALADQMATAVASGKAGTEQNPNDAGAWIDYGNALYDSVSLVREQIPDSPMYQRLMPRWQQAAEAYNKAIQLGADDPLVRSDMGVSQCFYGTGTGDQDLVRQGLEAARKAKDAAPTNARILLNLGNCMVSTQPAQTQEAIATWKLVISGAAAESPEATQAQQLIARYQ